MYPFFSCIHIKRFLALSLVILTLTGTTMLPKNVEAASKCLQWSRIFNRNLIRERAPKQGLKIMILPFLNNTRRSKDNWLTESFRVLLSDYLQLKKGVWVFPNRLSMTTSDINEAVSIGRKFDMDYVIMGSFAYKDPVLKTYAIIVDAQKKGGQIARYEGDVEYPGSSQTGLLFFHLASFISEAIKKGPFKEKKISAYINNPKKVQALKYYVTGELSLDEGSPDGVEGALDFFARAIQDDYNYVHAYLGYAQALAMQGFVKKLKGEDYRIFFEQAERELKKAELLNPYLTKLKQTSILRFLHAEINEIAAHDWLAKDKLSRAAKEYEKAASILPGNPKVHNNLTAIYQKLGKSKAAEQHYRELLELNRCVGKTL